MNSVLDAGATPETTDELTHPHCIGLEAALVAIGILLQLLLHRLNHTANARRPHFYSLRKLIVFSCQR
jgi:hypothetical protein